MIASKKSRSKSAFAVVMGDIIGSEKKRGGDLNKLFDAEVRAANRKYRTSLASPLTITLGDEFQGLVRDCAAGFEVVAHLRLALLNKDIPCRFVLGLVNLDTKVNPAKAWNMMGEGLAHARDKLNDKRDPNVYRFTFEGGARDRLLNAVGYSLTTVETGWTRTQLEYVLLRRELASVRKMAARLGITGEAVYKVLRSAQMQYYDAQRGAITFALSCLDRELGMP